MVVISNMEHLPECCSECPCCADVRDADNICVLYDGDDWFDGSAYFRIKYCPLKEINEFS